MEYGESIDQKRRNISNMVSRLRKEKIESFSDAELSRCFDGDEKLIAFAKQNISEGLLDMVRLYPDRPVVLMTGFCKCKDVFKKIETLKNLKKGKQYKFEKVKSCIGEYYHVYEIGKKRSNDVGCNLFAKMFEIKK
jgi:hypothetical protein